MNWDVQINTIEEMLELLPDEIRRESITRWYRELRDTECEHSNATTLMQTRIASSDLQWIDEACQKEGLNRTEFVLGCFQKFDIYSVRRIHANYMTLMQCGELPKLDGVLSCRIPQPLAEDVEQIAKRLGISTSDFMRILICYPQTLVQHDGVDHYLDDYDEEEESITEENVAEWLS